MKQKDMAKKEYNKEYSDKISEIARIPGIDDLVRFFGYRIPCNSDSLNFFPEIDMAKLAYLLEKKSRVYAYLGFDNSQDLDTLLTVKEVKSLLKILGFELMEKEEFKKEYWHVKSREKEMIYANSEKGLISYINTKNAGEEVAFVRIYGQTTKEFEKSALNHIEGRKFRIYEADDDDVINFKVDCAEPIGWIKLLVLFDQAKLNPTWNGKFRVGKLGGLNLLNDYDKNEIFLQNGRYDREVTLDKIYQHDTIRNIVFG